MVQNIISKLSTKHEHNQNHGVIEIENTLKTCCTQNECYKKHGKQKAKHKIYLLNIANVLKNFGIKTWFITLNQKHERKMGISNIKT